MAESADGVLNRACPQKFSGIFPEWDLSHDHVGAAICYHHRAAERVSTHASNALPPWCDDINRYVEPGKAASGPGFDRQVDNAPLGQ
jgi:hypothetical protein